jgi:hypothetical protein
VTSFLLAKALSFPEVTADENKRLCYQGLQTENFHTLRYTVEENIYLDLSKKGNRNN